MTAMKKKLVLFTFPPLPTCYSMSPFSLKAESFLRINKIPYEITYTTSFGKNKTIPYLRIFDECVSDVDNDKPSFEELSDSNEIITYLLESPDFDTTKSCSDRSLTKVQSAIAHAFLRMLEEHTSQTGFYFRYALHMSEFCEAVDCRERVFMGNESKAGNFIFTMFRKGMPVGWMKKARARGFVRYKSGPDTVWSMAFEDLKALEEVLSTDADTSYFFGQSLPGSFDCAVFGHLSQLLYIPIENFPHQKYLEESCPNLLRFMMHFKHKHFPDWEKLCEKKPNDALGDDNPQIKSLMKIKKIAMVGLTAVVATFTYFIFIKSSSSKQEL